MALRRSRFPAGFSALWGCVLLDLVGFGIVLPILPLWAERFGARPGTIGALVATYSAFQLVCAPLWGRLSDRVGRKPVLVLSLLGTAAGSLLTGLASSLVLLFVGRAIDGMSGASVAVAQAAVADLADPRERPRLLGLIGAAFGLGFVAGPALGALAALGGPRAPFLVAAALAAGNAVVAIARLPETHAAARSRKEAGAAASAGGPGGGGASRSAGGAAGAVGASGPAEGAAGAMDGGEASSAGAGAPRRRAGLARLLLVAFISLVAFSAFEATFSLFGERRLGLRLASTGAVFAGIGLAVVAANAGLVAPAVRRLGERGALRLGLLLDGAGLALLAVTRSWAVLVPALLALCAGQGLVTPTLSSSVAGTVGAERRGGALGLQQAAGGLARVVGPLAGGFAFQRMGVPVPYVAGAVLAALCVPLVPKRAHDRLGRLPLPHARAR
jgi:MFS transporter, DHA1 family, tetracycline resistance protein